MANLAKLSLLIAGLFGGSNPIPLANRNGFVDPRLDSWTSVGAVALGTGFAYTPATMYIAKAGVGGAGTVGLTGVRTNAAVQAVAESSPILAYTHNQTTQSTGTVAAGTAPVTLLQNLEGAGKYSGKSVTYQVKLWVASGTVTIPQIYAQQVFGTGGSPSAAVVFDKVVNWVVGTTPKKFSVRLDVPSVAAKTFGTTNDTLAIGLWLPPGVTFTINAIEPQIELSDPSSSSDINGAGGAPTTFEYRGEQAELARVQRFYWTSGQTQGAQICTGQAVSASGAFGQFALPVTMRGSPVVSATNLSVVNAGAGAAFLVGSPTGSASVDNRIVTLILNSIASAPLVAGNATIVEIGISSGTIGSVTADARL